MSLTEPANRAAFKADERGYMNKHGLTEAEAGLIERRDWAALIEAGGNIYLLLKIAGTVGTEPFADGRADARGNARRLHADTSRYRLLERAEPLTMARIVGGIGCSHAPSIAHSYHRGQQQDPMWAPLYSGFEPAKQWLARLRPDLMIVLYNDHMNRFF